MSGYDALRNDVGAVFISRDVVRVHGAEAETFLQGQLSQDITKLINGTSSLSFILQPHGKVDALVRVTRTGEDFILDTANGFGDEVVARLTRFKLRTKVTIEGMDNVNVLAVRGANALEVSQAAAAAILTPWFVADSFWPQTPGVDIFFVGDAALQTDLVMADTDAYEALRIENGMPEMGSELDEKTIPGEAGLNHLAIDFKKGCYTGQELVARIDSRGNKFPRYLAGVIVEGPNVPTPGATITGAEESRVKNPIGSITSAVWSEGFNAPVALAFVKREVLLPATGTLEAGGDIVAARLVTIPFANEDP